MIFLMCHQETFMRWWIVTAIFFVIIIFLSMIVVNSKERLMFYPSSRLDSIYGGKWVTFNSPSGKLSGYHINKGKNILFLYSHGNGGNLTWYTPMAETLEKYGDVLLYDYPGYGLSEGTCYESSVLDSGLAAYDYATTLGYQHIICYGFSMGGAVSVHIASQRDVHGMILQGTFSQIADCVPYVGSSLVGDFFRSIDRVPNIKCPVVVLHSKEDGVVPYSSSQKLFRSLSTKKLFIDIFGGHNDNSVGPHVIKRCVEFLKPSDQTSKLKSLSLNTSVADIV